MISLNGNAAVQGVSKFGAGAVSFDGSEITFQYPTMQILISATGHGLLICGLG